MTLDAGNIVQENSGEKTTGSTSHPVSLTSAAAAGNTILLFISSGTSAVDITVPAGSTWALDLDHASGMQVFRIAPTVGGEQSWTFTTLGNQTNAWYMVEITGLDLDDPTDATATSGLTVSNGGTVALTTPTTAGLSTIAFAAYAPISATSGVTYTLAGYTNGFTERADTGGPGPAPGMAVALLGGTGSTQAYSTTATFTTSSGSAILIPAAIVTYREAGTLVVTPLSWLSGFEWGTHGGGGNATAGGMWGSSAAPVGTWGTNYLIQSGSARNGGYGLRVVCSASSSYVSLYTLPSSVSNATVGMNVRVNSGSGIIDIAEWSGALGGSSALPGGIVYDVTNQKFGARVTATGTPTYQSGTTPLGTWAWIDWRTSVNSSSLWTVTWRVETGTDTYTGQGDGTHTATASNQLQTLRLGNSSIAQTSSVDYDDVVVSRYSGTYPLGPHTIRRLGVDQTATPTTTSPATDFNTFTANGTLAAWNATTARAAVDEVPPTVSASADGVVQVAVNAAGYAEFPMETYTLGPREVVAGVRAIASTWSTTAGSAVTWGMRGYDGTTEAVIVAVGATFTPGAPTALSATAPLWRSGMWVQTNGWTQAELDAAALRVGFSTDVAPGVSALYLEVATAVTRTRALFGDLASVESDPFRGGVVSLSTTAPAGGDVALYYEVAGSPTSTTVPAGTTGTAQLNAAFDADVNYISAQFPAEPAPAPEP